MQLKFRLSNRQRKELFVRGARLDIALPIPHDESEIPGGDLARFAASLVEGLDEARVRRAEWQTILVDPIRGRKTPPLAIGCRKKTDAHHLGCGPVD